MAKVTKADIIAKKQQAAIDNQASMADWNCTIKVSQYNKDRNRQTRFKNELEHRSIFKRRVGKAYISDKVAAKFGV